MQHMDVQTFYNKGPPPLLWAGSWAAQKKTIILNSLNECVIFVEFTYFTSRSHWPRGLRHRSSAARLLRLWVRIQPGSWMFVCCECCVLSDGGFCDGLITRPEESYRL
jgi:hypothetical protein